MKIKLLLFTAALFCAVNSYSQDYLQMIDEGTSSVEEIVASAEAYFADKDKGRGTGYKQFKRWEYMAKRLMNENGYLTSNAEHMANLESFNSYLNETAGTRAVLNDNWEELGPLDWNATTGWNPGVGRITGVSVEAGNTDHMIVGANTGGVWRTTDGGNNWQQLNDSYTQMVVFSVAIDPSDPQTYYFGSSSGRVYKSTDSGGTWNAIGDFSNSLVNKILVHPTNSDIIFACSQNAGLYRTTDGGATWSEPFASTRSYDVEFKPGDVNTVYASGLGVFKSTDGGANFTEIGSFNAQPKMMGVSPDDPTVLYVVEADGGSFGELYRSNNSGTSFTGLGHTNRNYFGFDTAGFGAGGQAPRDMDIAVNPTDVDEVHIAGVLTWRSLNGGLDFICTSDWIPQQAANAGRGYCHADVDILEFFGTTLYAGTDGGIFIAENTTNLTADYYEDLTTGIGIRQFYKIGVSQTDPVVVNGGSQDNGSSFYTAANGWRDYLGADGMENFVDKNTNNTMYGMSQFGQMYRTDNGGNNIIGLNEPGPQEGEWVTPFEQDPSVTNTIYLGYERVYRSTNKGNAWSPISQVLVTLGGNERGLDQMKIAPSDNQVIYASNNGTLFRTQDGGATNWTQMTAPGGGINSISIHPTNPLKIAVAVSNANKVRVSEDGGSTWESLNTGLPNFASLDVQWHDNGENGLYLGMNYGVFYIDDTFTDWQPYSNGIPNVIINELEINEVDGKIYAGSYGRGLWASPLFVPTLGIGDKFTNNDVTIFPNPANDELNIQLREAITGAIRIFDVTGKLMIYKPESNLEAVSKLNISGLNQGVYFVRINSEFGTITKKLLKN